MSTVLSEAVYSLDGARPPRWDQGDVPEEENPLGDYLPPYYKLAYEDLLFAETTLDVE